MHEATTLLCRASAAALLAIGAITGCELVLDAHEATLDPTCCTGGVGGNGSTSSTSGGPAGTGGHPTAGFSFAITDANVNVPYGGFNYVNVEITRTDGFEGAVDVTVQGAPSGLVAMPLNIPAGSNTGKFQVSAETVLTLGHMFTLTLIATSGSIVQTASVPAVVTGKPGDFDMSFGGNGLVAGVQGIGNAGGANLYDVKELEQGDIVAAGNKYDSQGRSSTIGLRFLPSGMPDASFNTTGVVSNSSCNCVSYYDVATSVAREVDGTLLFVGYGNPSAGGVDDIFVFRYKDDGAPDPVSGDQGVEDISLGGSEVVNVAALVPSTTKVIVAGAKDGQLFVARIPDSLAGGGPDNTFATPNGWIAPPLGGASSSASALTFDAMGKIIVTGWVMNSSMDADVAVLRLTPDGALDSTFMGGGMMKLARPGNQNGSAVLVQPDGKILVAADTDEQGSYQLLLQRFLPSGAPDSTFGKQGVVLASLGGTTPVVPAGPRVWMVLMLDGRIVVAGNPNTFGSAASKPVFARVLADGSPDLTFGTNGLLTAYVGDFGALGAMTLASDGKLLIAGSNGSGPSMSFVARLWN